MQKKILVVAGTRPEVIKLAPVVEALRGRPELFEVRILSTGQHREMLTPALSLFNLHLDFNLDIMSEQQTPPRVVSRILNGLEAIFSEWPPDWVLVQGDTATAIATGLACFYARIPCGHVEAGLRTGDLSSPWPEEMHRILLTPITTAHFSPTEHARQNLLRENVPRHAIIVTGNTVIDALFRMVHKLDEEPQLERSIAARFEFLDSNRRLILVTGHRRESFGTPLMRLCEAMRSISERPDVQLVYSVHMNPNVREPVQRILGKSPAVLIEPQEYLSFIYLMRRSDFIISDSGGVQEEAPSLGKPVLVTRDKTERVEAVQAGTVKLVGTDGQRLYNEAIRLLDDRDEHMRMSQIANPYGDGHAGQRISDWLASAKLA